MSKFILVTLFLALTFAVAFGQGAPKAGEVGVQGSVVFTNISGGSAGAVGIKYLVTEKIGLRAGIGILNQSSAGVSTTLYSLGVGFEYHFAGAGGVSPYVGAQLSYSGESVSSGGSTPTDFGLAGVLGGEYFFSSNFSVAGEARLGFESANTGAVTATSIGTLGFATYLTWYLK